MHAITEAGPWSRGGQQPQTSTSAKHELALSEDYVSSRTPMTRAPWQLLTGPRLAG